MAKNIVICFDGTGNQIRASGNTNVVRGYDMMVHDLTDRQISYYDPGVGTDPVVGTYTPGGQFIARLLGVTFGIGLRAKLAQAYTYLIERWEPGDRIFIFGFSRGAFCARGLAGLGGASGTGAGGPAAAAAAAGAGGGTSTRPSSGGSTTATGPNTGSVPGTYGIGRWGKPTTNKDEKKDEKSDLGALAAGPIIAGSYTAGAGMGLSAAPTPSPMSGMGIAQPPTMMTAGAAGQHRQEDEDQHFTPEFLVSLDNGNELVGPLPKVSPAVIGVWNEEHVEYQNPHASPYDPKPYDGED
ncbi:Uncharacterized conserved protein (DUF2235) [Mycobacteroides abscessus subsp. abscessus]|nr:Uncharacterized conserved protein (DUF2235) [Mycobacteroides abscessus subsp. abscessus]